MREVPELERHCGSWIIVRKSTGEAVWEVYDRRTVENLPHEFVAVSALQWLCAHNWALCA